MEDVPPSYDFAVSRDPWAVVAPWIPSADLCSAALVSRKWHFVFSPFLWGNPTSHFGTDNDAVYVALTRFRRILRRARIGVRQLTHTLHLPPALSEIYGGPNAFWLRDVLEYLPNLQSLIISRLPFFDHHSLIALRHPSEAQRALLANEDHRVHYDLKLLLAEREPNTTSAGIREALLHFPKLVYLDLSYTTPARDPSVLSLLAGLWDLQVLKLRGIGLRDYELSELAAAIGIRVRILDIRDNQLSDAAVLSLNQACFLPPERTRGEQTQDEGQIGDWPIGIPPGPDFLSLDSLRSEDLDNQLLRQLTNPLTGRLAFEDLPHKGLTHLYVSGNDFSYGGLSGLIKTRRIHVLDAGPNQAAQLRPQSSPPPNTKSTTGAKDLCAALVEDGKASLSHLRVHHSIFTETFLVTDNMMTTAAGQTSNMASRVAELDSTQSAIFEAPAPAHHPVELPTENDPIFELSGESVSSQRQHWHDAPPFDPAPPVDPLPVPKYVLIEEESSEHAKRGDGVFAPEPAPVSNLEAAVSAPPRRSPLIGTRSDKRSTRSLTEIMTQIDALIAKRLSSQVIQLSSGIEDASHRPSQISLHPSHLPHLQTLILTNVPAQDHSTSSISQVLKNFITACAEESRLAELQAKISLPIQSGYNPTPAQSRRQQAFFALQTIVLEIDPTKPSAGASGKSWDHSRARLNTLRSSTGDVDSEVLWSAAENDFSFFGEEGEEQDECGIPQNEPEKYYPTAAPTDEKIICEPAAADIPNTYTPSPHLSSSFPPPSIPSPQRPLLAPSPVILQSPRNLPLGRNRRPSGSPRQNPLSPSPRDISPSQLTTYPTPTSQPAADHTPAPHPALDVVADLAAFRRERKSAHETAMAAWRARTRNGAEGVEEPFTPGHWKGAIKIVRNAAPKGRSGVVDTYGNFFEKGYLYP